MRTHLRLEVRPDPHASASDGPRATATTMPLVDAIVAANRSTHARAELWNSLMDIHFSVRAIILEVLRWESVRWVVTWWWFATSRRALPLGDVRGRLAPRFRSRLSHNPPPTRPELLCRGKSDSHHGRRVRHDA